MAKTNAECVRDYKERMKKNDPAKYELRQKASNARSRKYFQTLKGRYASYKDGAKVRKIYFNMTIEEFSEFWKKPCTYCGDAIETIGLDRVENSIGYVKENVVSACPICNYAKKTMGFDEFISWVKKVAERF